MDVKLTPVDISSLRTFDERRLAANRAAMEVKAWREKKYTPKMQRNPETDLKLLRIALNKPNFNPGPDFIMPDMRVAEILPDMAATARINCGGGGLTRVNEKYEPQPQLQLNRFPQPQPQSRQQLPCGAGQLQNYPMPTASIVMPNSMPYASMANLRSNPDRPGVVINPLNSGAESVIGWKDDKFVTNNELNWERRLKAGNY